MEFYQPYSLLFKKSDSTKLRIHTRVYMPGNQNLMESDFDEATTGFTKIEFKAVLSSSERDDRIVEVSKEFDWKATPTDRFVTIEIFDLANASGGKNALHTSGATQY